tara:strand:+ start:921 stop:1133 length:213 start_codon:yes stop_codon:yes gene_type:complete
MLEGTKREVTAYVPLCLKRLNPAIYLMACNEPTVEKAYRRMKHVEHLLPIPIVKPWKRDMRVAKGWIPFK